MFNKKDPLIESVQKVMQENAIRREAERQLNEELGIVNKKALPHEYHAQYDAVLNEAIQEALKGNQHKIDANKNNKIDSHDFKLLRARKEKEPEEHGVEKEREMASKGKKMYEEEQLDEKAVSKAQHRFFGLVRAIQKGKASGSKEAEKAAKTMSVKSVRDYAKTKEKGLPERKDEMKEGLMDFVKGLATGGGQNPSSTAPKPSTSMALGGASTQASAPPVGAGPGSRAPETKPYGGIGAMGGQGTAAAEKAKGTTSIATGGAKSAPAQAPAGAPDKASSASPAPSAPRTSERVASQQANVPDSRNLRTAVKPAAGEGAAGKALAAAGVSKADRLNPNFLKSQGITAKAGSAEANLALKAKMQGQQKAVSDAEGAGKASIAAKAAAPKPAAPARPGQSVSGMKSGPSLGGGVRE